jgi:type IV secretory pathway TrbD component
MLTERAISFVAGLVLTVVGLVTGAHEFAFFGLSVFVFGLVLSLIDWGTHDST